MNVRDLDDSLAPLHSAWPSSIRDEPDKIPDLTSYFS